MKKILFCGGGSAGHVIPNIAVIESLKGAVNCVYMGTNGIEKGICKTNKVEFFECPAVKFDRGNMLKNLAVPFKLIKSVKAAGKLIDEIQPDLVFCKGGYAALPPAFAAFKRKIPVITHESDISAGLANKLIARRCKKVLTTFPSTARKFKNGICTGSPIRGNLFGQVKAEGLKRFGLDMRPTLLVLGGGSGSKIINECVRKIAPRLCMNYNVLHLCGKGNLAPLDLYGYTQIEFADDMGLVYACADAALSRCGSNAANELIALKIPTLFVPLENKSSRGDQVKNAEYFDGLGVCRILRESKLEEKVLYECVCNLFNDGKLKKALETSTVKCGNEAIVREIMLTLKRAD